MPWGLIAVMVILAGAAVYVVKTVLSDDSPKKKNNVTTVTLLKPPPPPQVKEKPPEPEQVKQAQKQEVIAQVPQNAAQQDSKPAGEPDNAPAGDNLGVDAEGSAGGDAFGLVGKKGGRGLISGGGGNGLGKLSLRAKFAFYTQAVGTEVRKKVLKRLDENGGMPRNKLQTVVQITLDVKGVIVQFSIIGSSGNQKMDEAVRQALSNIKVSDPPPDGMPRTMIFKISSQG